MLYQELPRIESTRLDRWARWLAPAVILGAALTLALLLLLIGQSLFAAAAVVGGLSAAAFVYQRSPRQLAPDVPLIVGPDYSLVGARAESRADCTHHQRRLAAHRQRSLSGALWRHAAAIGAGER